MNDYKLKQITVATLCESGPEHPDPREAEFAFAEYLTTSPQFPDHPIPMCRGHAERFAKLHRLAFPLEDNHR